jgi:hypothetical protein
MMTVQDTSGYLVTDARGRWVGRVECSMYGTAPDEPDAIAVRSGRVVHRHFIVPLTAIDEIDDRAEVIGLRLDRSKLQRFF